MRRRLMALASHGHAGAAEVAAASLTRELRVEIIGALGTISTCGRCAAGKPWPHGRWAGGYCCGTPTKRLFTDDELASLRLGGTTPGRLRPPRGDLAGCAFRSPSGCSLEPGDRPTCCVRYLCRDLEHELHSRGDLPAITALVDELNIAHERFVRARAGRLDDEAVGLTGSPTRVNHSGCA